MFQEHMKSIFILYVQSSVCSAWRLIPPRGCTVWRLEGLINNAYDSKLACFKDFSFWKNFCGEWPKIRTTSNPILVRVVHMPLVLINILFAWDVLKRRAKTFPACAATMRMDELKITPYILCYETPYCAKRNHSFRGGCPTNSSGQ